MMNSIQSLLDSFPEGVIQIQDGTVLDANAMARHYLPQLTPGAPLPDCLLLPREAPEGAGSFTSDSGSYNFSYTRTETDQVILFRPAPQTVLTERQLDGFLYQLRGFLGDILADIGPYTTTSSAESFQDTSFSKSFYRIFRLMGNLEYMQQISNGHVPFAPVTMDLDGLCRETLTLARGPLSEAKITLDYEGLDHGLLIPGDYFLLRRMLLGLIANSAASTQEGRVTLTLRHSGSRALLSISDNGPLPDPRQLAALFQQGSNQDVPLPNQGAGLGLSIARDIVARHKGALLVEWGQSSPVVLISLPTGPLDSRARVKAPIVDRSGGLDPILVELADVLPSHLFKLEGLD